MSDELKDRLVIAMLLLVAFGSGYFWPRSHYEVRERPDGLHLCAVQWNGSAGCSNSLNGWIPMQP